MAITDINISEELQTNAPSIKYRGNEGPKSPKEQEQALLMRQLRAEYERYVAQANPANVLSFEDWYRMSIEQQAQTRGPRAMAAYGGIMGVDGRRQYGLGSSLKKFVRKVIPNEVSDIAVKAAPFVAPFNPIAAGLMSGIGGFDQHGSISKGLKSGLMNYGLGQGARYLGGADLQGMSLKMPSGNYFSKPTGSGGIKNLFKNKQVSPDLIGYGEGKVDPKLAQAVKDQPTFVEKITNKISDFIPESKLGKIVLGGGALALGTQLLGQGPEETVDIIMDRGEGLDIAGIRAEVIEAYKDSTGEKLLALRSKYPFLGAKETKNIDLMAEGGRIGYANGVGPVLDIQEDDLSISDFMQDQGIPHGQMASYGYNDAMSDSYDMYLNMKEKGLIPPDMTFDDFLQEMSRKKKGSEGVMAAQGGRIGFNEGSSPVDRHDVHDVDNLPLILRGKLPKLDDENTRWGNFIKSYNDEERKKIARDYKGGETNSFIPTVGMSSYLKKIKMQLDALDRAEGKLPPPKSYPLTKFKAQGGRIGYANGGIMNLGGKEKDYRNTGGFVDLGAKEKADDVPARLSVNEFVMTADAVRGAGGGDIDKGAEIMENVMKNLEKGGRISEESQGSQGAQEMFNVSERLSEVV